MKKIATLALCVLMLALTAPALAQVEDLLSLIHI